MRQEANLIETSGRFLYLQRSSAAAIGSLAWSAVAVQLYFNVEDALIHNEPIRAHVVAFFSYFTVETNISIALVLTLTWAFPKPNRFLTSPSITSALVVYIIVVGVVYELFLRHLWHPHGMRLFADMVLHDAIPLLYSLYWLFLLPKGSLRWSDPLNWLSYPILFFVYTMFRGLASGLYPYPFLNAGELGFERVGANAVVFLFVFIGLGAGVTAVDRALSADDRDRSGIGSTAEL